MRRALAFLTILFLPVIASAHEVYVLTPGEIASSTASTPFNMIAVAFANENQFMFWGFVVFVVISTIFFISIFRRFERSLAPFFARVKPYAPAVCRITVGLGLLAGAYYQATYGPELPLMPLWGSMTPIITALITLCGLLMLFGVYVRFAAIIALSLFAVTVWQNGTYMFTYVNYLGEFVVLLVLGTHTSGKLALGRGQLGRMWHRAIRAFEPYAFAVIRVSFGVSLLYAAYYAKIIHNDLALQVATMPLAGHAHGVAYYLGFEPHFLVLGAALIEVIISLFFILGIEIRWTSIFLEFWLSLSLIFFGEAVWPHLILIGIPIAFIMHGYDRYSLEGHFFKRGKMEPVL